MIELRGLHLGNIARSPAESARPDLWPDHAWVPALGRTGGVVYDLCERAHMEPASAEYSWVDGDASIALSGVLGSTDGYPSTQSNIVPDRPFCAISHQIISPTPSQAAWTQIGLCGWSMENRSYRFGIVKGTVRYVVIELWGRDGNPDNLATLPVSPEEWSSDGPTMLTTLIAQWTGSQFVVAVIRAGAIKVAARAWSGGVYQPATPITHYLGNRTPVEGTSIYGASGTAHSWAVLPRPLSVAEMFDLHADPLLPFRRRQQVFYSVPSEGGSIETPAAMMMAL